MAGDLHRCMVYRGRRIWTWCGRQLEYMPLAPFEEGKIYGANGDGWIEINPCLTYEHIQETPARIWDIYHQLGHTHPDILLLEPDGREFKGYIAYESATKDYIQIKLAVATAGKAIVTT